MAKTYVYLPWLPCQKLYLSKAIQLSKLGKFGEG